MGLALGEHSHPGSEMMALMGAEEAQSLAEPAEISARQTWREPGRRRGRERNIPGARQALESQRELVRQGCAVLTPGQPLEQSCF